MIRLLLPLLLLTPLLPASDREADHAALRQLLGTATTALNQQDFPGLGKLLAKDFRLTFADQKTFTDLEALAAYHRHLKSDFGITGVTFGPAPDGPTIFLDESTGYCTGTSTDVFQSAAGSTSITSRWTATVHRDSSGTWKVATFHAGVDLLDNPILDKTKLAGRLTAILAAVGALILGLLGGVLLARRRST